MKIKHLIYLLIADLVILFILMKVNIEEWGIIGNIIATIVIALIGIIPFVILIQGIIEAIKYFTRYRVDYERRLDSPNWEEPKKKNKK